MSELIDTICEIPCPSNGREISEAPEPSKPAESATLWSRRYVGVGAAKALSEAVLIEDGLSACSRPGKGTRR